MLKNQKGITLVSLVITIIVLLILATVAITLSVSPEGIFGKANNAAQAWNSAVTTEDTEISNLIEKINALEA